MIYIDFLSPLWGNFKSFDFHSRQTDLPNSKVLEDRQINYGQLLMTDWSSSFDLRRKAAGRRHLS